MTTDNPISVTLLHSENCGHCIDFKPHWEKLKLNMRENKHISFKSIEASDPEFKSAAVINGNPVHGVPTIKIGFGDKEYEYTGERTADDIGSKINKMTKIVKGGGGGSGKTKKMGHRSTRKQRVFTQKNYESGDGMMTSVWGPSMWHMLHTMSFNYPVTPTPGDKKQFHTFVTCLQYTIPCKYCRMNLVKNFAKLPLTQKHLESRDAFSRYIYELHELVNTMLGKTSGLTFCDVRDRYENFRARCSSVGGAVKKETGCTEPLWGKKSKCVLLIVPKTSKMSTFKITSECLVKRK